MFSLLRFREQALCELTRPLVVLTLAWALACTDDGKGGGESASGGTGESATGGSTSTGGTPTTGGSPGASGGASAEGGSAGGDAGAGVGAEPGQALPEGDTGIAADHPGDEGIEGAADVIFADDFESYQTGADLWDRWDNVYQNDHVAITRNADDVYHGDQALEFTVPQQTDELSDATDKIVSPEEDRLFLRYYSKFEPPYDVVGSSHNGSGISAHYFMGFDATPGVPADGTNKFLVNLENWRGEEATPSPGQMNLYVYHPLQRDDYGDHFFPNGEVMPNTSLPFDFGPDFQSREQFIPELDRWYCFELMVQANTPGENDGRLAFWIDGELRADFLNLRLRDVASLKIDRFQLSFHIRSNPNGETRKWYDNVVAARSYIGPLVQP